MYRIKDNSKIPRDPTFEELKTLCRPSSLTKQGNSSNNSAKSNYMINNISSTNNYSFNKAGESSSLLKKQQLNSVKGSGRYKEKSLKIKVKKNNEKVMNNSNMEIDDTVESDKKTENNNKDINLD